MDALFDITELNDAAEKNVSGSSGDKNRTAETGSVTAKASHRVLKTILKVKNTLVVWVQNGSKCL